MFELTPSPAPHDDAGAAYWPTPAWVTEALLDAHRISTAWVLEPSAGEGGIAEVLARFGYQVAAIELRQECDTALRRALQPAHAHFVATGMDFLKLDPAGLIPRGERFAIIGNPPYDPAASMLAHVRHAVQSAAECVALLLPTSFLHSETRAPFNLQHPPNAIYPLARRPAFAGGGGKLNVSWFVWDRKWSSKRQLIAVIP